MDINFVLITVRSFLDKPKIYAVKATLIRQRIPVIKKLKRLLFPCQYKTYGIMGDNSPTAVIGR